MKHQDIKKKTPMHDLFKLMFTRVSDTQIEPSQGLLLIFNLFLNTSIYFYLYIHIYPITKNNYTQKLIHKMNTRNKSNCCFHPLPPPDNLQLEIRKKRSWIMLLTISPVARNVDSVDSVGTESWECWECWWLTQTTCRDTLCKYLLLGTRDKMSQCQNFSCKAAVKGCYEGGTASKDHNKVSLNTILHFLLLECLL